MRVTAKSVLQGATVACGLALAAASPAWAAPIHVEWSGSGWDTHIDNFSDGYPVNITVADANGSFGVTRIEISCEFTAYDPQDVEGVECEEGYDVLLGVLYSAHVGTYANLDQLYGASNEGWMCVNMTTGHYYGDIHGGFAGGTGRFLGASGWWQTTFEGQNLELPESVTGLEPVGFRSITGKMKGEVNMHGSGVD